VEVEVAELEAVAVAVAVPVDVDVGVAVPEDEDEDALALGVAFGVGVGVEVAEVLGAAEVPPDAEDDGVDGAAELVDQLGELDGVVVCVLGDGAACGSVACADVVVGAVWMVSEVSGGALVLPGTCVSDVSVASDAIEEIEFAGWPVVEVCPDAAEAVAAADAIVCCVDGLAVLTGAETAEAWAGWLVPTVPRVSAAAAAAMPTTPTELSSTPFVGCGLSVNGMPALWNIPGFPGFTRACRAPVLLSPIGFPSR
jgi:hypothetical protein